MCYFSFVYSICQSSFYGGNLEEIELGEDPDECLMEEEDDSHHQASHHPSITKKMTGCWPWMQLFRRRKKGSKGEKQNV